MRKIYCAAALLLTIFIAGCGSDKGEGVAPSGSTIVIFPSAINFSYTGSFLTTNGISVPFFIGQSFVTVTVFSASGNPVKGASVTIFNAGSGTILNSDRVGTVGSLQAEPYVATTDDFGNAYVYILVPGTDAVSAASYDFGAFSGSAFTKMTVTVTCTDSNTATATVCD